MLACFRFRNSDTANSTQRLHKTYEAVLLGVFYPYLLQDPRCTLGEGRQASRQPSDASTRHYCMTPSFPIQIWNLYRKSMHT